MSANTKGAPIPPHKPTDAPLDTRIPVETPAAPAVVKQRAIDRNVKIVMAVAFYFAASMALVFLNKRMFASLGKGFPLFVTWWQFVVALGMIFVGGILGESVPSLKFFAPMQFKMDVALSVAPVTLVFVGMVVFNNLCLKYVEVSFYQVARSLTVIFSVIFTYVFLGQKTSFRALLCCGVLVAGFLIGSWGEVNFSVIGSVFGVISSMFVAAYGIYVKRALNVLNNDSDVLLIYNTILSIIVMAPIIIVSGELGVMLEDPILRTWSAWVELTIAGMFGLLINIATYLQISLTSALTHNISGTAKATLQTVVGVMIYQNPVSAVGALGIAMVLIGSFLYSYVRKLEMDAKDAQQASQSTK